ncbi:MAG: hypothetical protein HQ541_05275 [Mariniphaga sp.]|nr:hypothetical protein [Mariniphaga sp.]
MNKTETKDESFKPLVVLGIIILVMWLLSFGAVYFTLDSWTDRGTFGDLFGGINSLFSGLALAGIIYTIFLQRKELKLQRLELIETRKELTRSAKAQEKSEIALKEQADSLKKSSQLTALSNLINYYTEQQQVFRSSPHFYKDFSEKRINALPKLILS